MNSPHTLVNLWEECLDNFKSLRLTNKAMKFIL